MAALARVRRAAPFIVVAFFVVVGVVSSRHRPLAGPATEIELERAVQHARASLPRQLDSETLLESVALDGRVLVWRVVLTNLEPGAPIPSELPAHIRARVFEQARAAPGLPELARATGISSRYIYSTRAGQVVTVVVLTPEAMR